MATMDKRQTIILVVLGIVVLYAAVDFLTRPKNLTGPGMALKTAEMGAFVTELTSSLGQDKAKSISTLIFSRAEKEWKQDPFLDAKSYRAWTTVKDPVKKELAGAAVPKIEFVYSGYLETNRKRMAVINGVEYREGENMDVKGYVVANISPARVVIVNREIGATVNVPLLE
jgi:hypothetical protein